MSVDNEEQFAMDRPVETSQEAQKKSKLSYTREFLLSLSGFDVCKKLPSGVDESLLREFEDAPQDRQRISRDFSSHGFRRNDYSSSPPTRGELGSYARGIHGSRSTGRSDRDCDSQSDLDSDSGRRYGNQSRKPWQVPEHDGLLGKGSFPKPSGYATGTSAERFQSSDSCQLNRSNEPYHPPRPYKAVPHLRRDAKDSYNDETFGFSDSTGEDRAEEERKRRASFELLRREQQKAFQERQKLNPERKKDDFEIAILPGSSRDEKGHSDRSNESDEPEMLPGSNNSSLPSQNTASRPLVPPGFASTVLERKSVPKTSVGNSQLEGSVLHTKGNHLLNGASGNQEEKQPADKTGSNSQKLESTRPHASATKTSEKTLSLSSILGISSETIGMEKLSSISKVTEAPNNDKTIKVTTEKLDQKKLLVNSNQEHAPSILDKLFNSALTLNSGDSSSFIEQNERNGDDTWSPQTVKSSKFAHLFLKEEKKPVDDILSSRPSGLPSLIQGAEKFQTSDVKGSGKLSSGFPFQSRETTNSEQLTNISTSKSAAGQPILTCEDLEQCILSEVSENDSSLPPSVQDWNIYGAGAEEAKAHVDDRASQHLLSLLQRGTGPENMAMGQPSNIQIRPSEKPAKSKGVSKEADSGNSVSSGKRLTLEALFGTAFMKELQSVGEPVSGRAQVSEAHALPLHVKDEDLLPRDQIKSNGFPEPLFGFNDQRTELNSRIGGFDGPAVVRFPEEDSLRTLGDPANLHKFMPVRGSSKQEPEALNSVLRNERPIPGSQDGHSLFHPRYPNEPEIPFQQSNFCPSPPQLESPQLINSGPMFHSFNPHHANLKSQINFVAPPGNIGHHDPPENPQFPPNMIRPPFHHHPGGGIPDFDCVPHPMLQQMHMQGNLPPPNLLKRFPSGAPQSPHLNNQLPGLIPEMNQTQGFPFGHRRPNYAEHEMPPVPDVKRSDHPASLQRLLGMESRVDPHRQGSYSHELDLGFGYNR